MTYIIARKYLLNLPNNYEKHIKIYTNKIDKVKTLLDQSSQGVPR